LEILLEYLCLVQKTNDMLISGRLIKRRKPVRQGRALKMQDRK